MIDSSILYRREGAIATITLNRPHQANTLRLDMLEAFGQSLAQANLGPEMKLNVVEGAGDYFSGAVPNPPSPKCRATASAGGQRWPLPSDR